MKRILFFLMLFCTVEARAQSFNNEWIDYNKTYYKFFVGSNGLYRIDQSVLAGLGIGNAPSEHFQLWRNGEQVPLFTSVPSGPLGTSGFIEFWGEMNDGKPDKIMYRIADHQLNDKWSLETDTAAYFLTINPSGNNLRLVNTPNNLISGATPVPFFYHTQGVYFKQRINPGYAAIVGSAVYSSSYDQGEGWTSTDIGFNATRTENLTNLFPFTGTGANTPILSVSATGNALNPRTFSVSVNSTLIDQVTMDYFDYVNRVVAVPINLISTGSASIAIKNLSTVNPDRMALAKLELQYPRNFNFGGANQFSFELAAGSGTYLEIAGFNHGGVAPILYDMTNGQRYICDIATPGLVRVQLATATGPRRMHLLSQAGGVPRSINILQPRTFTDYSLTANQGNYLIVTHPAITTVPGGGSNPVEEYRAYRSSAAGGGHNAKIYMIDQLIDQFAFGIRLHPLSVRNFIRYARATYAVPVKNVLLIGKGVEYVSNRNSLANPDLNRLSFIPTFGNPASDILLAADPGLDVRPKVSIGRLSVINGQEVRDYLDKVIQYEQQLVFNSPLIRDKAWTKNVVHVIGSGDGVLGDLLTASMNGFTNILSDTAYGANVHTFSKLSTAPVEQANAARMYNLFEEGIGMLTYFGHSSASTLEFNLDNPDSYNNTGRYPVFVLLGCNAGNFYTFNVQRLFSRETISEKFVLAPQRGSIATIASTGLGIVNYLDLYHGNTVKGASVSEYGKSVGEIMLHSIQEVFNLTTQDDFFARFHCEQSTLHGDPALVLKGSSSKPDYVIEDQQVRINPSFVSVADASFKVEAAILNLGKAVNRNIVVEVKRTYPDQTTQVIIRDTIRGIRFSDTVRYNIPILALRDKGLNKISICVDADNLVDELYESNNCITKDVFVYEDEARPVYPYNFSIVNNQNIKLTASTANPFAPLKHYRMEIDTTELFNSPLKSSQTISSAGGVLEFSPGLTFIDSTVYYWRVAPVPVSGQPIWNIASFFYKLSNTVGFSQNHYFQHNYSSYNRVNINAESRQLNFDSIQNLVLVKSGVFPTGFDQASGFSVTINNNNQIASVCGISNIVFNVIDPVTMKPWFNANPGDSPQFGSDPVCGMNRIFNFQFNILDTNKRRKIVEFLDLIPEGHYVIARNCSGTAFNSNTYASTWLSDQSYLGAGNSIYQRLYSQGFTGIDSFNRPRAFVFMYKKNRQTEFAPKFAFSQGIYDALTISSYFPSVDTLGSLTSPIFGPVKSWGKLYWSTMSKDNPLEEFEIELIGVRPDRIEVPLASVSNVQQDSLDLSNFSASAYPWMKLKWSVEDSKLATPVHLRYWMITGAHVPEGALSPREFFSFQDTVEVGQPMSYRVSFRNVSKSSFDSVRVKFSVVDRLNNIRVIPLSRLKPLQPSDTALIDAYINTTLLPGNNSSILEVNPDNDQPEQHHFNNVAIRNFYVQPDSTQPLLDVTFDGIHILNEDIVSARPFINIKLTDNARWMPLKDTSLLSIRLKYPNGRIQQFYYNTDTLVFNGAGQAPLNDNTASILFYPYLSVDGRYELLITARDQSNNQAGNISYRIAFQVVNASLISNLLAYPNPFSTSTSFVFTLTGTEPPSQFKIEILTVTGKIVREITQSEIGTLRIGRNITDFKWDGTDQFGQLLANGVYLYRVVVKNKDKDYDLLNENNLQLDRYFNRGYGKIVLIR